jgi:ubiquitin carboxyl-terminal hydrolase 7
MIIGKSETTPAVTLSEKLSPAHEGLRRLFIDMNESEYGRSVTTTTLCQLLDIPTYEQQDTQEFWKLFLPALKRPEIMDFYTGTYENYIMALDGSNRERRFLEAFSDISLDVVDPSTLFASSSATSNSEIVYSTSVIDALRDQFNQPELLSVAAGNGWQPSSEIPEKVDAHKGYQLKRRGLPAILQLHLKRFHYDWNSETINKLNHAVTFPLTLDLNTIVTTTNDDDDSDVDKNSDECIYELQAVIVHVGDYHSGHYYSYIRPNLYTDDWYRFNDEIHTKVRFTDVIQDAYGGIVSTATNVDPPLQSTGAGNPIVRFFRGIFGKDAATISGYGYGGPKSSAYVLQYIRRSDIPKLYNVVVN